jgi:hypothetical protein
MLSAQKSTTVLKDCTTEWETRQGFYNGWRGKGSGWNWLNAAVGGLRPKLALNVVKSDK